MMGYGDDGCNGLTVADYVFCLNNVIHIQNLLKYPRPSRSTPVRYRFLNRLTCGLLGRCGCVIYGEGKVGYLADGGI